MQKSINNFGWRNKDSINAFFCFIISISLIYIFTLTYFAPMGFILFGFSTVIIFLAGMVSFPSMFLRMSYMKRIRSIFFMSFFIHILFLLALYIYYYSLDGTLLGPNAMDVTGYHFIPKWMADEYSNTGTLNIQYYLDLVGSISDMGYIFWVFFWYTIFGSDLWIQGLLNIVFASFSAVLVYKIAARRFDEKVGIMAATMMLLHPFFIYYNSVALKETVMLWLMLFFFKQAQSYFLFPRRKGMHLILAFFAVLSLAFFRNFLAIILATGFLIQFLFTEIKRSKLSIILISSIILFGFYMLFINLNILKETDAMLNASADAFDNTLARRSANSLVAKFASLPAFIVLAFSGPLPSAVNITDQESILLQMGGAFIRNLMVIFSIFGMWYAFKYEFRKNILYLFFIFSYIFVIAYSGYGNSNRYNLVTLPILLIYTAKGIQNITLSQRKMHNIYLFTLTLVILLWNYTKLAGRGIM